jgi:RNA-directed DNA polymerase
LALTIRYFNDYPLYLVTTGSAVKLNTFPTIGRQVRAWLKAGVMDGKQLFPTSEGTPQGGVMSPLPANIALHGMEERIKKFADTLPTRNGHGKRDNRRSLSLICYADDFVILVR